MAPNLFLSRPIILAGCRPHGEKELTAWLRGIPTTARTLAWFGVDPDLWEVVAMPKSLFCWNLLALTMLFGGASLINLGSAYDPLDPALEHGATGPSRRSSRHAHTTTSDCCRAFRDNGDGGPVDWAVAGIRCGVSRLIGRDRRSRRRASKHLVDSDRRARRVFIGLPGTLGKNASKLVVLALLISHYRLCRSFTLSLP